MTAAELRNGAPSRATVLVVNANARPREQIARVLESSGFDVRRCDSASAAQLALCQLRPTVLVVDHGLGEGAGFYLMHLCRARSRDAVTIMTAESGAVDVAVRAMREGVSDFVAAPFDRRVAQAVNQALNPARAVGN